MSKHETLRRKLQIIRDSLLELNAEWFNLVDSGDIKESEEEVCPGDLSQKVHELASRVRHDESAIEKLLMRNNR